VYSNFCKIPLPALRFEKTEEIYKSMTKIDSTQGRNNAQQNDTWQDLLIKQRITNIEEHKTTPRAMTCRTDVQDKTHHDGERKKSRDLIA